VYDKLRTARLNVKYYGCRLQGMQRTNTFMEVTLALTAPTSAITGYGLWKQGPGLVIWGIFSGVAAIVALCKPIFGLTRRIAKMEGVVAGYRLLDFDLMEIKGSIEQERSFTSALKSQFRKASKSEKELVSRVPEARPNKKLLRKCRAEVESELPVSSFFIPEE